MINVLELWRTIIIIWIVDLTGWGICWLDTDSSPLLSSFIIESNVFLIRSITSGLIFNPSIL